MKKLLIPLVLLLMVSASLEAQQLSSATSEAQPRWLMKQFSWGIGVDNDHYTDMSLDRVLAFAQNPTELQRDLSHLEENVSTVTAGMSVYGQLSFAPLNRAKTGYRSNREVRLGVGIHTPKEAMISYQSEELDTSLVFCNIHAELSFSAAYVYSGTWGERWEWYCGYGMSVGRSFSNEMLVLSGKYFGEDAHTSEQEYYEPSLEVYRARPVTYSRIFLPYGIHYRMGKDWSLGFDFRTGVGVQAIAGREAAFIRKTGTFVLGAKYQLR